MLKFDYIRHFIATAETGSIKDAAEKIRISPTSIRHSIEKLETGLNATLFVRRPSEGVSLTNDGYRLLERTTHLISDVEDIESLFITSKRKLRGNLIIGCQEGLTWSLVPRAIELMNQAHPDVNISVKTVWMETQFETLEKAEVDVLLTFTLEEVKDKRYQANVLCRPQACAMMRKGHDLDNGKPVKLSDLANYPHIFIQDGPAMTLFSGMYQKVDLEPVIYMYSNISTGAQSVVGRTDAISLRILRPAIGLTPLGDGMVVPMIKDKVQKPWLVAMTNKIKRPLALDKRTEFIRICHELFDGGQMKKHIYY